MRKIYHDVDGVLLTRKNVRMADGAMEFIDYVLSNFDCYWLTTHCRSHETDNILKYLSEFFPSDIVDKLAFVKPSLWDTGKTEGIDFDSDFYWLDDYLFEFERMTRDRWLTSPQWNQNRSPRLSALRRTVARSCHYSS